MSLSRVAVRRGGRAGFQPRHKTTARSASLAGRSFSSDMRRRRGASSTAPPHPQQVFEFAATLALVMIPRSLRPVPPSHRPPRKKVHRQRSLRCVTSLPNMASVKRRAQFGEEVTRLLRGPRAARIGLRLATPRSETLYSHIPRSYRHNGRVEHDVSHRKQRLAARPTRHKIGRVEFL